ncbi:MAG: hypothetical protein NTX36_11235 [Proteobacteria bacterium]|nr:hypothetical protein [Pseudomonadota bacterium]
MKRQRMVKEGRVWSVERRAESRKWAAAGFPACPSALADRSLRNER